MKLIFTLILVAHGLIHLLGAAKAFGAALPLLTQPISRPLGALWLAAAVLFIAAAIALFAMPRVWWIVGAAAVVVSQVVILTSWTDARFGTIANVLVLVIVVLAYLAQAPGSFRAQYASDVARGLGRAVAVPLLTEADLAPLPAAVRRYVLLSGAVGQPRVQNFRARFHGRIRSGPDARWMSFTGEQDNFFDQPSRLFLMDAAMFGVPFQAFHRFVGPEATMRVKVASVFTMVDAHGPQMDAAETVTLFNDLCVMAPGSMVDPAIVWQQVDAHTVYGTFTNAGHTVRAVLTFNDLGELTDFVADGRGALAKDGRSFTPMRWSTPLSAYRDFGAHRLMSHGECVWHAEAGNFVYLQFEVASIEYNVGD